MTSHALVVLTLALVCSTAGTSREQTADRASEHAMHTHNTYTLTYPTATMKTRTNIDNYNIVNKHLDASKQFRIKKSKFDEVYSKDDVLRTLYNIDDTFGDRIKLSNKFNDILNDVTEDIPHTHKDTAEKTRRRYNNAQIDIDGSMENTKSGEDNVGRAQITKYLPYSENKELIHINGVDFDKDYLENTSITTKLINYERIPSHLPLGKNLKRVKRQEMLDDSVRCEAFSLSKTNKIEHPHNITGKDKNYYSNIECVTVIKAGTGQVVKLTFVDVFHIEDHPKCLYDYLEIRDGKYGYAKPLGRYCGEVFPPQITSSGPYLWLKFRADETIEYEGFTIKVELFNTPTSHTIPEECYKELTGKSDVIDSAAIDAACISGSANHALDVLWKITTEKNTYIYLNFTTYALEKPNECEENVVQVFGYVLEDEKRLAHYCGSVANSVTTRLAETKAQEPGNVMYVHMFVSQAAIKKTKFQATFTAYRLLDPSKDEKCKDDEFNCEDNTCIALELKCDQYAHCRLKADEDAELCKGETESMVSQPHILVILVIFSLILSGMSFVFLFKCIRKLYQDHKIIKEHIRQSCEDRLDSMLTDSRLMLDAKRLHRDSQPRASLERDNHANEMFKQQRSISQHKVPRLTQQSSIESDFQETHLDMDEEPWRRDVTSVPEPQQVKIERNGRPRKDTSKKEESMKRKESVEEKKEIRDAAVGVPDTKESGCQTRESLFQADTVPSSDGSNSNGNSRAFSTFGYSGATLVRPSPPPAASPPAPTPAPAFSSIQIELLRQIPPHESKKKLPDRRPMSAETTRSAPDVIIVSKPIR